MEDLVKRAQSGDRQAIDQLYREYHQFVYNYILKRVKNRTEAEDLTSQVFIRLLEKLGQYQYRPGHGFANWLFRIAHNLMVDKWRKDHRIELMADVPDDRLNESAEDEAIFHLTNQEFSKFLDCCTKAQKEVVELKFLHNLSNEQIAEQLETTVGAIKSMQHRAFDSIKEEIKLEKSEV